MKKLTKRLFALLMVVSLVCVCAITASASGSGYVNAPKSNTGSYKSSTAYACYAASENAPLANTYTYFKDYSSLSSDFASNNDRRVTIQLWEDDVFSNDLLKTYTGKFSGRTLSEINLTKTNWTDTNVEPAGDHCAELFIKYKVDAVNSDKISEVAAGLFKFSVGIY